MTSTSSSATPTAKRDTTATAFLAAVLLAAALTGVATLSAAGTGALQELLRFAGYGRSTALELEQRRQAEAIAGIERILANVMADVGGIDARVKTVQAGASSVGGRLARIDSDIGALRDTVAKRLKQADAVHGQASDKLVHGALMEVASLRSTLDTTESAHRRELAIIDQRLGRLEQALSGHDMTNSAQQKPAARQAKRPAPANAEATRAPSLRGTAELGAARRANDNWRAAIR